MSFAKPSLGSARIHGCGTVVLVGLAATVAGCGSTPPPANLTSTRVSFGSHSSYQIVAGDQHSAGGNVVITQVTLAKAGYIAIHADVNGAPGTVLGVSPLLSNGTHDNVVVHLSQPAHAGTKVMPVVHVESKGDTSFDYPKDDPPATVEGRVVVITIQVA